MPGCVSALRPKDLWGIYIRLFVGSVISLIKSFLGMTAFENLHTVPWHEYEVVLNLLAISFDNTYTVFLYKKQSIWANICISLKSSDFEDSDVLAAFLSLKIPCVQKLRAWHTFEGLAYIQHGFYMEYTLDNVAIVLSELYVSVSFIYQS